MGSRGWIKRVLPFFAAFAVGVFIASLFGFGGPRFGRQGRWRMKAEVERLRTENEELRNDNLRLRNECHRHHLDVDIDKNIPDFDTIPLEAPLPPPAPMPHRPPRKVW